MKNKILCAILCVIMLFSVFSVFAFATDSAAPTTLKEEIQSNLPDMNLDDFTVERGAAFIGGTVLWTYGWPMFAFYFYFPEKVNALYGEAYFEVERFSDDGSLIFRKTNCIGTISLIASEGNFHKFEMDISPSYVPEFGRCNFLFSKIQAGDRWFFLEACFSLCRNDNGETVIEYEVKEVVELEIHSTNYVTKSTPDKYDYDNIVSLYFSIPQKYQDWYDSLYSVTCEMLKRRTKPIFVSNLEFSGPVQEDFDIFYLNSINAYLEKYFIVSESGAVTKERLDGVATVTGFTGVDSELFYKAPFEPMFGSQRLSGAELIDDFCLAFGDYDAENFYDINILGEVLDNYVKKYSSSYDLFIDKAYNKFLTKTIDETWDYLDYSHSADFVDYWLDFGFFEGIKYLFLKDDETKLYKFFEELGIAPDGYNYEDEPYLVKVDDYVRSDLSTMEAESFCDKYAIGYQDYENFKKYVSENENVLIYRIDVDSYISMPVKIYNVAYQGANPVRVGSDSAAGIIQTYVYDDVQVIDITMCRDGVYHSLKTSSNIVDIYPDLEGIEPELPNDWPSNGEFWNGLGRFVFSSVFGWDPGDSGNKRPWWLALLITALVIAAVIIAVVVIVKLIQLINTVRMNRYLREQTKNPDKKNE